MSHFYKSTRTAPYLHSRKKDIANLFLIQTIHQIPQTIQLLTKKKRKKETKMATILLNPKPKPKSPIQNPTPPRRRIPQRLKKQERMHLLLTRKLIAEQGKIFLFLDKVRPILLKKKKEKRGFTRS